MALGGGYFTSQNKILPGSYINFVSLKNTASGQFDRGVAAIGLELDWGADGKVFELSTETIEDECEKFLGYPFYDDKLKGIRDIFKNAKTVYAYKLNSGGVKAANTLAEAVCAGTRGNDIKISVAVNADDSNKFDVQTIIGAKIVDVQTVTNATELKDNDFVTFKEGELEATAAMPLTGGENGTVTGQSHQDFLDRIESYSFNAIGVVTTDDTTKKLYAGFAKRMREEMGIKFQAVVFSLAADYEGVVNVKNSVSDAAENEAAAVYWATGAIAGCELGKSNTNKLYDGEYQINAGYTQVQLEQAIKNGEFCFHKVNDDIRVLVDINSLTTVTEDKGEVFKNNATIRVIDEIATSIAGTFNDKYIGRIVNDKSGQISLWADIVKHHVQMQDMGAIEDFSDEDVVVNPGKDRKSVVVTDNVKITGTMEKLYMTCNVE